MLSRLVALFAKWEGPPEIKNRVMDRPRIGLLPAGAFFLLTFVGDGYSVLMFLEVPIITIFTGTNYNSGVVEEIRSLSSG